jgi:hypothetical protein
MNFNGHLFKINYRSVESLRQSSIKHQVLQVDEELGVIERVVRKVEQANEESVYNG